MTEPRNDPLAAAERPTPRSGRKPPIPKRKKPGAYRVPPRENRHGLFIVITGDGKGKTTAALGLLRRAIARRMTVGMFQFLKRMDDGGEHRAARRLGVATLASRPSWMHAVVTARDASPALIDAADLVTEMRLVRHAYREQGIGAHPGIEL